MTNFQRFSKILLSLFIICFISSCMSKTVIKTVPPKAKVFINDEFKGETPYVYSDNKISGSKTGIRIEKFGYESFTTTLIRNENVHGGAVFAGIVFGLWPFLWTMEYNPERTYELKRDMSIEISQSDTITLENKNEQITVDRVSTNRKSDNKKVVLSVEYQKLLKLKELFDEKILTDIEYESEKNKILDPMGKYGNPTRSLDSRKYPKLRELKILLDQGAINEQDFIIGKRDIVGNEFYKFYKKKNN